MFRIMMMKIERSVCPLCRMGVQLVRTKDLENTQELKKSNKQTFHGVKLTES